MLVNVPLNDFFLGIQNLLKPFASAEHSAYPLRADIQTWPRALYLCYHAFRFETTAEKKLCSSAYFAHQT
jgi:hypothetical protein